MIKAKKLEKSELVKENLYSYYIHELKISKQNYKNKEELKKKPIEETTIFQTKEKELVFVGGLHTLGPHYYIKFLTNLLNNQNPDIILVEEQKSSNPKRRQENIKNKDKKNWTEVDWLYNWGAEHSVMVYGMEMKSKDYLKPFMEEGGIKLVLFVSVIHRFKNSYITPHDRKLSNLEYYDLAVESTERDLFSNNLRSQLRPFIRHFLKLKRTPEYKELTNKDMIRKVIEEEMIKYVSKGEVADLLDDHEISTPYPFSNKYKTNKIWTKWDVERDYTMIQSCIEELKIYNHVVAVAGSAHIQRFRNFLGDAIKEEFGKINVIKGYPLK